MENSLKLLLVFLLATMVSNKPLVQNFLDASPLQLIFGAVDFYNTESHSDVIFEMYRDEYEYKVGPRGQRQANFTIKETVCQKSENRTIGSCEFKFEGLEKRCTASRNEQEKSLSVVCTAATTDPGSGYMEKPGNQEDDYAGHPEDEASYEDHVVVMDENDKTFLEEEDEEEKRIIDEVLASRTKNTDSQHLTSTRRMQSGQFLGRFLCLDCFFDILPRK